MIDNSKCWLKKSYTQNEKEVHQCNYRDCNDFCIRYYKLNYLYEQALISPFQREHRLLVLDINRADADAFALLKDIENNIVDFVGGGKNLYIHSSICGNGKSSWALRLVEAYFNNVWYSTDLKCRALFINVPQFLLALKDNISDKSEYVTHIKECVLDADLVIWDDIGNKISTQFEGDNLLSIIETRMSKGKSNVYTSNLTDEEAHRYLGDRLASRVINSSIDVCLKGADKRGLKL